jgi:hypothetical protein
MSFAREKKQREVVCDALLTVVKRPAIHNVGYLIAARVRRILPSSQHLHFCWTSCSPFANVRLLALQNLSLCFQSKPEVFALWHAGRPTPPRLN